MTRLSPPSFDLARRRLNQLRREVLDCRDKDPEAAHCLQQEALLVALQTINWHDLSQDETKKLTAKALRIHNIRTRW